MLPKAPRPLPDLPLEIWLEIFQFATYVYRSETIRPLNPFAPKRTTTNIMDANTPSLAMRTKRSLVLVSRSWRCLGIQILYRHIVIRSPARANAILQVLECSRISTSSPDLRQIETPALSRGYGQWTRHIEVYTYMRGSGQISFLQTVFKILCHCPNLQFLSGRWTHQLPVEFLRGVSRHFGPSLQGLCWADSMPNFDTVATPEFLSTFQALQTLDVRYFKGSDPTLWSSYVSRPTLPCVQDIILSNNPRSLQVATILDLPKLRNLTLHTKGAEPGENEYLRVFLKAHGHSLNLVDLPSPNETDFDFENAPVRRNAEYITPDIFLAKDACPNLESIVYSFASPFYPTNPHDNLLRIGIRGITAEFLYPDKPSSIKNHLTVLTSEKYPRLELVQLVGFLVEAHADSIMKDACIWWVEKFEKMGILFLDGECVFWMYTDETPIEHMMSKKREEKQAQWRATSEQATIVITDRCVSEH